jgi:hypothetical protein
MIGEAEEQGDWNQCFFGSVSPRIIEEACRRFWAQKEIDFIERDDNGKIIEIVRTDVERARPNLLYLDFEKPKQP